MTMSVVTSSCQATTTRSERHPSGARTNPYGTNAQTPILADRVPDVLSRVLAQWGMERWRAPTAPLR
jgi:hypothetical protein